MPPLWRSEFRHVLLKHVRADLIEPDLALELWSKAVERLELCEQPVFGDKVLDLAIRFGCSSYDAEFVVLAKELNCREPTPPVATEGVGGLTGFTIGEEMLGA